MNRALRSRWEGSEKAAACLKIQLASEVCDLYEEENHKAVIFRKMKVDEQKSDTSCFRMGRLCSIKMPIFLMFLKSEPKGERISGTMSKLEERLRFQNHAVHVTASFYSK